MDFDGKERPGTFLWRTSKIKGTYTLETYIFLIMELTQLALTALLIYVARDHFTRLVAPNA
jgi:hypothetical protein